jgi:hypothetical protein
MAVINSLVEGPVDEAAAARIIRAAGHISGVVYGRKRHRVYMDKNWRV